MDPRISVRDGSERSTPSDEVLVRAAQAGSRDAIECLLERHYAWLVRLLSQLVCDPELAHDVTQDAMLSAARQIGTLRDGAAFRPWLYRIASNRLHSVRRARRLRHAVSLDELTSRAPRRRELSTRDALIDTYGERAAVHDVLDRLDIADRELLLLRYVAGFTGVEVARITGISPDAARQRIMRAVRRYHRIHAAAQPGPRLILEREPIV